MRDAQRLSNHCAETPRHPPYLVAAIHPKSTNSIQRVPYEHISLTQMNFPPLQHKKIIANSSSGIKPGSDSELLFVLVEKRKLHALAILIKKPKTKQSSRVCRAPRPTGMQSHVATKTNLFAQMSVHRQERRGRAGRLLGPYPVKAKLELPGLTHFTTKCIPRLCINSQILSQVNRLAPDQNITDKIQSRKRWVFQQKLITKMRADVIISKAGLANTTSPCPNDAATEINTTNIQFIIYIQTNLCRAVDIYLKTLRIHDIVIAISE